MSKVTHENWKCVCLSCGNTTEPLVKLNDRDIPAEPAVCEKCSNPAYPLGLAGTGWFMQAVAKELAQLKGEMFDIQCYIEEQEGQGE